MAGHSHWAKIKRAKGANDAKRGKIWSKIARKIIIAAKNGGDPRDNLNLRYTIDEAKAANMPRDTIEKAIKKGTGELGGGQLEEVTYEGYGPNGVAITADILTDNRNRTVAEIRFIFGRHGGNMGETGCVGWMFKKRGVIAIEKSGADEDKLIELALEAGADDVTSDNDTFQVMTAPENFNAVRDAIEKAGIAMLSAEVTRVPENTVAVSGHAAEQVLKLMEELEEHEDVQSVSANFDISDEEMAQFSAA